MSKQKAKFRAEFGLRLWVELDLDPSVQTFEQAVEAAKKLTVDNVLEKSHDVMDQSIQFLRVGTAEGFDV